MLREDAYRIVQRNAHAAFDEKVLFDEKIKGEPEIKKLFSDDELDELFSFAPYTTHADEIFNRVWRNPMITVTLTLFILITLFHVYMGLELPFNKAAVLPIINGKPMPFHSLAAWPVAIALAVSTISFAHATGAIGPLQYSALFDMYLWVTGFGLLARGIGGLVGFHC